MSESVKRAVPMSAIRPSGGNPRREFGDIGRLARSIAATGGQPLQPLAVVEDGGAFRIVDGERRWRALKELGAQEAECVVFAGYGEAEEAVAMLAADEKKALDPSERARGFQRVLALGVPDEEAAGASGLEPEQVRRARRVKAPAPEQASMEALLAAADFEDEADQARVLASPWPDQTAKAIVREHKEEASRAKLWALLTARTPHVRAMEGACPSRWSEEGKRLRVVGDVLGRAAVDALPQADVDGATEESPLLAWPDGKGWAVRRALAEGEQAEEDAQKARDEEAKAERAASSDAVAALLSGVERWLAAGYMGPAVSEWAQGLRRPLSADWAAQQLDVPEEDWAALGASTVNRREAAKAVLDVQRSLTWGLLDYQGRPDEDAGRRVGALLRAALQDGYDGDGAHDPAFEGLV